MARVCNHGLLCICLHLLWLCLVMFGARNSRNPTSNGLLVCNMRMTCWHSHQPQRHRDDQKHDEPRCSRTDRLYNKSYSTRLENPNDEYDVQYDVKYDSILSNMMMMLLMVMIVMVIELAIIAGWLAEDKQITTIIMEIIIYMIWSSFYVVVWSWSLWKRRWS